MENPTDTRPGVVVMRSRKSGLAVAERIASDDEPMRCGVAAGKMIDEWNKYIPNSNLPAKKIDGSVCHAGAIRRIPNLR